VLRAIPAVRCNRGYTVKYKFYPSQDVALVSYYRSNRGVVHLSVLWKPEGVDVATVISVARRALGLETIEKIIVKGETVEVIEEDC
jgi:hypothetical protein